MPLSLLKSDGVRTDVSDGLHANQIQPMRRARLQKKSVRKLNQTEAPATMELPLAFRAHRRHRSASALFLGPATTSKVEIITSMSSAGIPRPPQLPVEYQNDSKLMSDQPLFSEAIRENLQIERTSAEQLKEPAEAATATPPPSDISIARKRFRRTAGPFASKTQSFRPAPNSLAEAPIIRPSTSDGTGRIAMRMASAPSLIERRKGAVRFDFDSVTEEEGRGRCEYRQSSASSSYSTYSGKSSLTSNDCDLDHVRQALSPGAIDKEPLPNPFIETKGQSLPENACTFPEVELAPSIPEGALTPRPESGNSLRDWSAGRLPPIPSEPPSRISKVDSFMDHRTAENDEASVNALGIQATPLSSDANLLQACHQLEEQLEAVSERIHAQERASESLSVMTSLNDQYQQHTNQPPSSPSFSSSSHSSPHSDSGDSTVGTPMTECSPSSFESNFPKPTLHNSSSLLCLLDDVNKRPGPVKADEDEAIIDASSATQVIYHILAALPDLTSLFSAALISRGFYQVFKAHELQLIRMVVRKMSHALWEICELSHAKGNFLTMDDNTGSSNRTPTSLYLRDYDHAMYTVVALKVTISDRCRGLLRDDQISHFLCEADEERAFRIDTAIWRVWTFCATFGCHTGREQDVIAQKSWLNGGASKSRKYKGKKASHRLSRKEIEDLLEVWNALFVLLRSLDLKVADAKNVGLLDRAVPERYAQPLLDEWLHYILSLGPRAVLDLTSTWPHTSSAVMQKAKSRGWTDWVAPQDGSSMATFLHEAATRLHVEAVLSETRDMSFSLPARAASRSVYHGGSTSGQTGFHRKAKSESPPQASREDVHSSPRARSATTSRANDIHPSPPVPLRSKASGSSTQSNESKVLKWKQTISTLPSSEKRLSATKPLPEIPQQPKRSSVPKAEGQPRTPSDISLQTAEDYALMMKWSLLAIGPESPPVVVPNRSHSLQQGQDELQHPALRITSRASSSNETERSARLSPLVEFGEGQFALPYGGTQNVKPPQRKAVADHKKTASTEGGSSLKSDRSRTSEDTVSETILGGRSFCPRRRRRPTSSMFDAKSRQSKKERRKSSAQFYAHMSQACEMHGLC